MKVGFYSFDKDRTDKSGSARIRVYNLIKYDKDFEEARVGQKYDAVVFQKYYWPEYARIFPGIRVLDICDPDWLAGATTAQFAELLKEMDGVVANTEATADYLRKMTKKPVVVIPDRHDIAIFKGEKVHKGRAKSVVWFGYSHNASVLMPYIPKLQELGLRLTIISEKYVSAAKNQTDFKDMETFVKFPSNIAKLNQEMMKHDFALLPVRRRPQEQYKSNNKITHSWALGLPVAEWGDDIERLLDPQARIDDQKAHQSDTRAEYDCKKSAQEYREFIELLAKVTKK